MHARIRRADAGLALYLAVVLVVLTVLATRWLPGVSLPGYFKALAVLTWGLGAVWSIAMLVSLLVTGPAKQRRTVYAVTNYRVIVSCGSGAEDGTSVYLDQLDGRMLRPDPDGTGDVLFRAGSGGTDNWRRMRSPFGPNGLGLAAVSPVSALRAVPDPEQACRVIAEARRRMRAGEIDVLSVPGQLTGPAGPGEITLAPGENVLWTGAPTQVPWWFGGRDVYVTAFGLVWVAFVAGMGVLAAQSGNNAVFLVWLGLMALVGVYPAAVRVIHRRLRIRRSRYMLTSRRLIATWRPLGGGPPVVVQAPLGALLPPVIRGTSVITARASADAPARRQGWQELMWPAATVNPPVLIGLADAQEVAGLIGAAQVATRLP